jgi:hypothetical protein
MDSLHWELSVLSKAIHYKNLSGASAHIGLSQPQLSRIISKLETQLNVVLLDRTVRRKSGWTTVALKIADTYSKNSRKLTQQLSSLVSDDQVMQVTVGSLEGLMETAGDLCRSLFENTKMQLIELDVYDLSELEEKFERDELDIIITAREPGSKKYKNVRTLGYQTFDKIGSDSENLRVMSPFEFTSSRQKQQKSNRVLLSNSLAVRKHWVETNGGTGLFPSEIKKKKTGTESEVPVYLIGSDLLNPAVWQKIASFKL